jgi:hypothetical protein
MKEITEAESEVKAEQTTWEWFARAHPHEAHENWPDRFWTFFQKKCPGKTREQMQQALAETASPTL